MRSSKELKALARETLAGNYGNVIATYLIMTLLISLVTLPFVSTASNNLSSQIIYSLAVFIISLVSVILSAGYLKILLSLARDDKFRFSDLFSQFRNHPDRIIGSTLLLVLLGIVICLPMIIGFFAGVILYWSVPTSTSLAFLIGFICLCVISFLAAIYVQLRFQFYLFFLVDHADMSAINALKESSRMMKGKVSHLLYVVLSFIPMMLLGLLSWGIGFLWIQPYYNQTLTFFYLDLTGEYDKMLNEEAARHAEEPQYGPEYYA